MQRVLVGADAILALLCHDDENHDTAVEILKRLQKQKVLPLLTNYILAQTHALLLYKLGADAARLWLRQNIWPVEPALEADEKQALAILLSGRAGDCTYTDAVTLAMMERLGINTIFTFNENFIRHGFYMA